MKKAIAITLSLLLVAGLAFAKGFKVTKQAGEFEVTLTIDKNPPVVGANKVEVYIKDTSGKAVADLQVSVDYGMPAMPGMPAMNYKTGAELKGDKYVGTLDFSMSGPWFVNVKINRGEKVTTAKFNVDVQ